MTNGLIWRKINPSADGGVFVVAEIGKNFIQTKENRPVSEYLENAKKMVLEAKKAGADAVKFQTHNVEDEQLNVKVVAPHFSGERYEWVMRNTMATPIDGFWRPLKQFCDELGIIFFSTPMSRGAAKILDAVGVDLWKIASCDILDFSLLDYLRNTGKPIIISSGMSTLEEVDLALEYLTSKNFQVALLHCVSKYPCPPEDLNLQTINFFRQRYSLPIGFSDHSIGIDSALAAVALGAKIIEKHFSLSRDLWGSDHKVSLLPDELKSLVGGIRELERNSQKQHDYLNKEIVRAGMGNSLKVLQEDEEKYRPVFRKCLMAGQDIFAGTIVTAEMIYAMRPQIYAGGLSSEKYPAIIGKKTSRDLKKYDPIEESALS